MHPTDVNTADRRRFRRLPRRLLVAVLGSILLVGAVATIGGIVAVEDIRGRLDVHDRDAHAFAHRVQQAQFRLTRAVEESFAYLVSGDTGDRNAFNAWAQAFPEELAAIGRDLQAEDPLHGRLAALRTSQSELVASAERLFAEFEATGEVDRQAFQRHEVVVDRAIEATHTLTDLGLERLEGERLEMRAALAAAQRIVRFSALLAGLCAILVAALVYYLLRRERVAREAVENVFVDLYDHSPDLQVSVDAASGRIVECNETALERLGYSRASFVDRPVLDFYHPASRDQARRCREIFRATGFVEADHLQILTASGEVIDVSLRATAVRDEQGRIVRSRSVWRDIRTRIRAVRALAATEARYRQLVESAPVCIHELDTRGRLTAMNPAGLAMLGEADSCAIAGVDYLEFVRDGDRERVAALIDRALAGESVDYEFVSDSNPPREFRSSLVPIRDHEGRVVRLMGMTQDLTESRNAERTLRQRQKTEAVGRLAGGIAHDFNNLLTVILGYCEELEDALEDGSLERRYVAQVSLAAGQAATLTRQLLAFSRNQVRKPEPLQVNEVIESLSEMLARIVGETVQLECRLEAEPGTIEADPGQIEQILVNLVANACEAMPSGGALCIRTQNVARDGRVRLTVSDTGLGIAPEVREQIFEPYFSTKEAVGGTGLGLATVLGIVEQHGGTIEVDSTVGGGTRVAIEFPQLELAARPSAVAVEPPVEAALGGGETILLVEDQAPVRDLARRVMESRGYRVLEAADGEQALQLAAEHAGEVDILVTDVVMPRMGGGELSAALRRTMPDLKVLYVSGYVEPGQRRDIPDDAVFLSKPYVPDELLLAVRRTL